MIDYNLEFKQIILTTCLKFSLSNIVGKASLIRQIFDQLMEDGRITLTGQNVRRHVEQEHRLELELVQTQLLNTVDLTVQEMLRKVGSVIHNLAQVSLSDC